MFKKGDNEYDVQVKISTLTKGMVILGFLGITAISLIKFDENIIWQSVLFKILEALFNTLFSAGLVSIVVEISTIKSIVDKALNKIFKGDIPIDSYSNERLEHINNLIAAKRGNVEPNFISDSIYSVEPQLISILNGLYYEYYNASYVIIPDRQNKIFKKSAILDYEIKNLFDMDNKVLHLIALHDITPNMNDETRKKKFKVTKFIINNTDLSDEVERYIEIINVTEKNSSYQYMIKFERELQHCKSHKIHIELEYEVPISDISQTFRLSYPCKSINHNIHVENIKNRNEHWTIVGTAFTSFYYGQKNNQSMHVKRPVDTNIAIQFDTWCIPGAGYSVYLVKK